MVNAQLPAVGVKLSPIEFVPRMNPVPLTVRNIEFWLLIVDAVRSKRKLPPGELNDQKFMIGPELKFQGAKNVTGMLFVTPLKLPVLPPVVSVSDQDTTRVAVARLVESSVAAPLKFTLPVMKPACANASGADRQQLTTSIAAAAKSFFDNFMWGVLSGWLLSLILANESWLLRRVIARPVPRWKHVIVSLCFPARCDAKFFLQAVSPPSGK